MPAAWIGAGAAVLGTVSNLVGGNAAQGAAQTQSDAANQAAQAQVNANNQAAQVQQNMFNTTQASLAPYMQRGGYGSATLSALMGIDPNTGLPVSWAGAGAGTPNGDLANSIRALGGASAGGTGVGSSPLTAAPTPFSYSGGPFSFDPNSITGNPTYQWALGEGTKNLMNSLSTQGGIGGNALEAITKFGQGTAMQFEPLFFNQAADTYGTNYQNAYNAWQGNTNALTNFQNRLYNMFSGQAGSGQNAAANLGGFATSVGGQIGGDLIGAGNAQANGLIGAGNARAAGQIGQANALSSGLSGLGTNALMYQMMNQNNPSYTGPVNGISNWLSGANWNGMQPNVPGGANDPNFGGVY
jgi:hypothetical protein